jgi:hypothetical protein
MESYLRVDSPAGGCICRHGGCAWDEHANRDTSDRRMIKEFNKEIGVGCTMSAWPDVFDTLSAEEGDT